MEFKFPSHKGSMNIAHNPHLSYYETVQDLVDQKSFGCTDSDWVSEEEKCKAIENNELWTLQWYPETPVGFCVLSASTLEAILEFLNNEQ